MKEWEDFLKGYGFVPWSAGGMQGWYRQTAFVKDCLQVKLPAIMRMII